MNNDERPTVNKKTDHHNESQSTSDTKKQLHSRKNFARFVVVVIALLLVGAVSIVAYNYFSKTTITQRDEMQHDGNKIITQEEEDIATLVETVSPSVVSITTSAQNGFGTSAVGAGTGIIVSADGYIMTNKHVISEAQQVMVTLSDGTVYDSVEVIGQDPLNDVAFLKVKNASNLKPAKLGDSTSIRVGQKVVAIGNSLGQYQNTVTTGIISATGRPIAAQDGDSVANLTDLIQTDAAINPGNSGGPLLNTSGQVLGINTAIAEGAQGIGFAIPINATKGILKGVLAGNGVKRAHLGVQYIAITPDVAKQYDLSVKKGAYIAGSGRNSAVTKGGAAEKAGLKDKDIITKVNGIEIGNTSGLASLVAEYAPGDTIELTIVRGKDEQVIAVTLAEYR